MDAVHLHVNSRLCSDSMIHLRQMFTAWAGPLKYSRNYWRLIGAWFTARPGCYREFLSRRYNKIACNVPKRRYFTRGCRLVLRSRNCLRCRGLKTIQQTHPKLQKKCNAGKDDAGGCVAFVKEPLWSR